MRAWPEPTAGEIVWCYFPDNVQPKPKARPALVLAVKVDDEGLVFARVAYGSAGLSFDTKFDLKTALELPFNSDWFSVPPHAPFGQTPQLGTLHPSLVRVAAAAFAALRD